MYIDKKQATISQVFLKGGRILTTLDCGEIQMMIPHRGMWCFPKIVTIDTEKRQATARIIFDARLAYGHDWGIPGVLFLEMIQQVGAILVIHQYCLEHSPDLRSTKLLTWLKTSGQCSLLHPVLLRNQSELYLECTATWERPSKPCFKHPILGSVTHKGQLVARLDTPSIGIVQIEGKALPERF